MQEAKILLTINLEGVLSNQTEGHILPYVKHDEFGKKVIKTGTFVHKERITFPCVQKLKISMKSYQYFISNEIPSWYKAKKNSSKVWPELSDSEKITLHCSRIAENHTFQYEVLDN